MEKVTKFKEAIKTGLAFALVFGIAMQFGWMNPYVAGWAVAVIALPAALTVLLCILLYAERMVDTEGSFALASMTLFMGVMGWITYRFGFGLSQNERSVMSLGMGTRNIAAVFAGFLPFRMETLAWWPWSSCGRCGRLSSQKSSPPSSANKPPKPLREVQHEQHHSRLDPLAPPARETAGGTLADVPREVPAGVALMPCPEDPRLVFTPHALLLQEPQTPFHRKMNRVLQIEWLNTREGYRGYR